MSTIPRPAFAAAMLAVMLCCAGPARARIDSEQEFISFCSSFKDAAPVPEAAPTAADRARFPNAESCPNEGYTFLLGGDSEELIDARRCWLATDSEPVGLAFVFANGWGGVTPDYDVSLHFFCRVDLREEPLAPYELWGMAEYVNGMRNEDDPQPLSFCPHATSGRGQLFCEQIEASDKEQARNARFDTIEKSLDVPARKPFAELKKAADAFADADADWREYGSRLGTGHAAMAMAVTVAVQGDFAAVLESMNKARAAAVTRDAARRVDTELNAEYRKMLAAITVCTECGEQLAPAVDVARVAQRAWLRYRDAWVAFYQARWQGAASPAVLQRECETALARDRIGVLRKPVGDL